MKTITPQLQAKLNQNLGTEPILLLEVEWVPGQKVMYSDRKISGADYPYPTILNIGVLDTAINIMNNSNSIQLSVTLDDVDEHLKDIYTANDIHKRPATLYFSFNGMNLADKLEVFTGEVVTPLNWEEGKRSLTFTVLSKISGNEICFSMEEGDFAKIPEEALGKVWPLVFGQVCNMPTVQVRAPRQGYLLAGTGIHDFTLDDRLCQVHQLACPTVASVQNWFDQYAASAFTSNTTQVMSVVGHGQHVGSGVFQCPTDDGGLSETDAFNTFQDMLKAVKECVLRRYKEFCRIKLLIDIQTEKESDTLNIYGGTQFPQGETVKLSIDGAKYKGVFTGNSFKVLSREHPELSTFERDECKKFRSSKTRNALMPPIGDASLTADGKIVHFNSSLTQVSESCNQLWERTPEKTGGASEGWGYYERMKESSFFWAPAGTAVFLEDEAELLHIVSLLPGTVDSVAAYKTLRNGESFLTEVPTDYYTVYNTDYGDYQVVEIGLDKRLSAIDKSFGDDIYVSFTSSVGPNVADIIEFLVGKYTDLEVDSASFTEVKNYTTHFPCHFFIAERKDVYEVIKEIAYQSRCSVIIKAGKVYLKYLPVEPSAERTLSESDILQGSFKELISNTDDVITNKLITWRKTAAPIKSGDKTELKISLKYNVGKYGLNKSNIDYYSQSTYDTILKNATFWLIRESNVWKKVRFKTVLKHFDLDPGDCVYIDMSIFSDKPVKAIIESSKYDPSTHSIEFECWTPIRLGETEPYYWAWPSQKPVTAVWPLPGDTNGGSGDGLTVTPPMGHLLAGSVDHEDQVNITTGDNHPTDVDATTPVISCSVSDLNDDDVEEELKLDRLQELAASVQVMHMEEQESSDDQCGTVENNLDDDEDEDENEDNEDDCGCSYIVTLQMHRSDLQGLAINSNTGCGGPCKCEGGCPSCDGPVWTEKITCASPATAQSTWAAAQREIHPTNGHWGCGEIGIVGATKAAGNTTDCGTGEACPDIDDPDKLDPANNSSNIITDVESTKDD